MVSVMIPLTSRKTGPIVLGGSDPPTVPPLLLTSFPSPSLTAHSAFLVLAPCLAPGGVSWTLLSCEVWNCIWSLHSGLMGRPLAL